MGDGPDEGIDPHLRVDVDDGGPEAVTLHGEGEQLVDQSGFPAGFSVLRPHYQALFVLGRSAEGSLTRKEIQSFMDVRDDDGHPITETTMDVVRHTALVGLRASGLVKDNVEDDRGIQLTESGKEWFQEIEDFLQEREATQVEPIEPDEVACRDIFNRLITLNAMQANERTGGRPVPQKYYDDLNRDITANGGLEVIDQLLRELDSGIGSLFRMRSLEGGWLDEPDKPGDEALEYVAAAAELGIEERNKLKRQLFDEEQGHVETRARLAIMTDLLEKFAEESSAILETLK